METKHTSILTERIERSEVELKEELAKIANLDSTENWSIFDQYEEEGLYLIHSTIEPKVKGLPRGIVVDLEAKTVVCDSFGFTPTAPLDGLMTLPGSHDISIVDEYINRHIFSHGNFSITPAYEGVIIRVFKHNNVVYFSTHKKLDCSRSKWGRSDRFLDMYKRLGGLSGETLFPEDVVTSPWCYNFLLVDAALLIATKQDIGVGFVVDLGAKRMWEYENCPYDDVKQHESPTTIDALEATLRFQGRDIPFFVRPPTLSLEQANEFLRFGYSEDHDTSYGESVILYQYDKNGKVCDSVRVQSTAYHQRSRLRGDNPNIRHRFYQLLNAAMKWDHVHELMRAYPIFYHQGSDGCFSNIYVEHLGQHIALDLRKTDDRIFLVYVHFYASLPDAHKEEGLKLWDDFKRDRSDVTAWLQELSEKAMPSEIEELSPRIQTILKLTEDHADNRIRTKRNKNRLGKRMGRRQLIKANIYNLILRESGPSLFKLIREMKRAKIVDEDNMQDYTQNEDSELTKEKLARKE